jgi:hypothetical protein
MSELSEVPTTEMTYTAPPVNPTTNGGSAELPPEDATEDGECADH